MSGSIRHKITHALRQGEEWLFRNPKLVLAAIGSITIFFALALPKLRIYSDFADLLPQRHPYIQTYNRIKENFGGANTIVMVVEVKDGTIFNDATLRVINRATQSIDSLPSVNHNLVSSLTHRTVRKVRLAPDGGMSSRPYYDASNATHTSAELEKLKGDVIADPQVFGLFVSPDLKAALIRAQLNESDLDYSKTFSALQLIRHDIESSGHRVYVTGNPVLTGWVYTYLNQILGILACTLALLSTLLVLYFRRLYGVALPLLGIGLSSIWGLGFMALMGINLEPLSLPIPFLIAARATSHGVQLVARYYEELAATANAKRAARNALDALFRPGSLAIIVDALGITALMLGTAPFNHKLGLGAGFWALSVIFTVHFMVPLALTVLPQPKRIENKNQNIRAALGRMMARTGGTDRGARAILGLALLALLTGSVFMARVQLGESEPGSPLLRRDHDYNLSTAAINSRFPGSEELHVVFRTDAAEGIKRPEILTAIERFQARMMTDPQLGGSKSLPTVVRVVNRLLHNDDPRWMQIPDKAGDIGGLMFAYLASSPIPGALKEFVNPQENEADAVFFYKDHRAETIDRVVAMAESGAREIERDVPGLHAEIGGGILGVTAAANQALHRDHLIIIPTVIMISFLLVMMYYSSLHAGWLMILPMLFSTAMTYAYMGAAHIGINVNTVPVIAVGVGVGIDYAVYFMDRIREEMARIRDIHQAVIRAVATTGYAVSFTAVTLVAGVAMWIFLSDLRFQSDAALLLSFMLVVNAIAAMLIVPAWCVTFRPHFVMATHLDADGAIEEDGDGTPQAPHLATRTTTQTKIRGDLTMENSQ
jgi:uncharacterized protein